MTENEMIYLSRQFANMFGTPVRLYKNHEQIYCFSTLDFIADPIILCINKIMKINSEVGYYIDNNFLYYGIVNHNNYKFVCGPVSEIKKSKNELKKIAISLNISDNDIPTFISQLTSLSGIHLDTVIQSIILYNFTVNGSMYDISDIRIKKSEQKSISSEIKTNEFKICLLYTSPSPRDS